jgi:hypothetical protein
MTIPDVKIGRSVTTRGQIGGLTTRDSIPSKGKEYVSSPLYSRPGRHPDSYPSGTVGSIASG